MRLHVRSVVTENEHGLIGSEAPGGAGGVHSHVAASYDGDDAPEFWCFVLLDFLQDGDRID